MFFSYSKTNPYPLSRLHFTMLPKKVKQRVLLFILNGRSKCFDWYFRQKAWLWFCTKFTMCMWFTKCKLDVTRYEKYLSLNIIIKFYSKVENWLIQKSGHVSTSIYVFVSMCVFVLCACIHFEGEESSKIKNTNLEKFLEL